MAIKYNITSATLLPDKSINVEASIWDDADVTTVINRKIAARGLSQEVIADWAYREWVDFSAADTKLAALATKMDLDAVPLQPAPVIPGDPELQAFADKITTIQKLQSQVKLGLLAADDPSIDAAKSDAKAAYKPQFASLLTVLAASLG